MKINLLKVWIITCCLFVGLSACEKKKSNQYAQKFKLIFAYLTDAFKYNNGHGNEGFIL